MYTCTALFPMADLPGTEKSENLPKNFLSAQKCCGINLRVNIWRIFPLFTKMVFLLFQLPVKSSVIPTAGKIRKITFMRRTGVLTLRKPLTALVMPSNIWDATPTKSPSAAAGFFLFPKIRLLFLPEEKSRVPRSVRSHWITQGSSNVT